VQTLLAGQQASQHDVSLDELRARYRDWDVTYSPDAGNGPVFLARKLHVA